jgi:hypothetical protein
MQFARAPLATDLSIDAQNEVPDAGHHLSYPDEMSQRLARAVGG